MTDKPMTVGKLIDKLKDFDQTSIVLIYCEDCAIFYEPLQEKYINQDNVEVYKGKYRRTRENGFKAILFG